MTELKLQERKLRARLRRQVHVLLNDIDNLNNLVNPDREEMPTWGDVQICVTLLAHDTQVAADLLLNAMRQWRLIGGE